MFKVFIAVLWLLFYFLFRLPVYWKAKRLQKQGKTQEHKELVEKEVKRWATRVLRHIRLNLTVTGMENLPPKDEVVVFVCNHQSFTDIPILLAGLDFPRALLSKKEIGKVPLLSGWMNQLGCIYVERDDARAALNALKKCEELLESGSSLIVFPEGSRAKDGTLDEFKGGAVRMALKAKTRIIPLAIDGSYKALEGNGFRLRKADVRLLILPAVETETLTRPEQKELAGRLQEMIQQAKDA